MLRSKIHEKIVIAMPTGHLKKENAKYFTSECCYYNAIYTHYRSKMGTGLWFPVPSSGMQKVYLAKGHVVNLQ